LESGRYSLAQINPLEISAGGNFIYDMGMRVNPDTSNQDTFK
jgi:hypothetical protein